MNFASDVVQRRPPSAVALVELARDGTRREWSFGEVADRSKRLAGTLIAAFGPAVCFSLNAASFLVVLLTLLRWRPERKPAPLRGELKRGIASIAWE